MKKSELRQIIKEELQKLNEGNDTLMKIGQSVKMPGNNMMKPATMKLIGINKLSNGDYSYKFKGGGREQNLVSSELIKWAKKYNWNVNLEEMTGTAATPGYNTPNAFSGGDADNERRKKTAEQLGYKLVKENRWLEINNEESTPKAKLGKGISSIKKQLTELEKFVNWYGRIKNESGVKREDYWKRTHKNLHTIRERLMNISDKISKI